MPLFIWKPAYEIDVAEIDMQHRKLVGIINELYEAMKEGQGQQVLDHTLRGLMDYVQQHFTTEERRMTEAGYPALAGHKEQHLDFTHRVLGFMQRHRAGEHVATPELMNFLRDWLKEHITSSDRAFGEYLDKRKAASA